MKNSKVIFWDVIVHCRNVATGGDTYEAYTQASSENTHRSTMKRNLQPWIDSLNRESKDHYYSLAAIDRAGNLDDEITRLVR